MREYRLSSCTVAGIWAAQEAEFETKTPALVVLSLRKLGADESPSTSAMVDEDLISLDKVADEKYVKDDNDEKDEEDEKNEKDQVV